MEDIKESVQESFEEKVQSLKETIDTLNEWIYDFEEKVRKTKNKLNFIQDDISNLEK
jgi:peptidoglycan hydrolase CwlO-like protein